MLLNRPNPWKSVYMQSARKGLNVYEREHNIDTAKKKKKKKKKKNNKKNINSF